MMPRLPLDERETLSMTVAEAVGMANAGYAADGYQVLLAGLQRARELRDAGETWGEALVTQWQTALDRFAEKYAVGRA